MGVVLRSLLLCSFCFLIRGEFLEKSAFSRCFPSMCHVYMRKSVVNSRGKQLSWRIFGAVSGPGPTPGFDFF